MRRVRRRVSAEQTLTKDTFHGWEADEPLKKQEVRHVPVEDTGLFVVRTWTDRHGIAHSVSLMSAMWWVLCESREFNDAIKRGGNSKLAISCDIVTCIRCALRHLG